MKTGLTADVPADLPARETVARGLADLAEGRLTQDALLVAIASDRLRAAGIDLPAAIPDRPKDRLWELLERDVGRDAHGRYNALVGRLLSFADALDAHRSSRAEAGHPRSR
jgi:hypothetical protein